MRIVEEDEEKSQSDDRLERKIKMKTRNAKVLENARNKIFNNFFLGNYT